MDISIRYIRVSSAGNSAIIAIHTGISVDELNKILCATFPDPDERKVVALIDLNNNTVIPLHTVSLFPQILESPSYNVLFGGKPQRVATIQQRQLFIAIGLLEEENGLHFNHAQMLRALVLRNDEMIMAAHEVFEMDGNLEELKDTLLRIAKVVAGEHNNINNIDDDDQLPNDINSSLIPDEYQNFLDKIVNDLHLRKMIDDEALGRIRDFIDSSNPKILDLYKKFQQTSDLNALVDDIVLLSNNSNNNNKISNGARRAKKYDEHVKEMEQIISSLTLPNFPEKEISDIIQDLAAISANPTNSSKIKLQDIELLIIQHLLEKEHPYLQLAYEDYIRKENMTDFVETLRALSIIYGISQPLQEMENKGFITRIDSILIEQLFTAGNPSVIAAWDVYVEEHDSDDFCDTLYRILMRRGEERDSKSEIKNEASNLKSRHQLRKLVLQLHGSGKLSDDQGAALMKLVDTNNAEVFHSYDIYLDDGDLIVLVHSLLKYADHAVKNEKKNESPQSPAQINEASLWKTIRRSINRLFIQKQLSSRERFVLIGLVNSKDEGVKQAMEQFARYRIQEALVTQLQAAVAKNLMVKPMHERTKAQIELLELIEALLNDKKIDSDIFLCLAELIEAEHPLVLKEYEHFSQAQDINNLIDKLLEIGVANVADAAGAGGGEVLSNNYSREVRMEGQINSFSLSKKIQQLESRLLIKSLRDGDPRVLAAFDVYDDLVDESDLVDTLRRISERLFDEEKNRLDFGTHTPHHHPPLHQRRSSLSAGTPVGSDDQLPAGLKRQRSHNHEKQQTDLQRKPKKHESEGTNASTIESESSTSLLKESIKEHKRNRSNVDFNDGLDDTAANGDDNDVAPSISKELISPPTSRLKGKEMRIELERKEKVTSAVKEGALRRRSSSRLDDDDNDASGDDNNEDNKESQDNLAQSSSTKENEEEKGTEVIKPIEPSMVIDMVAAEFLREGMDAKSVNILKKLYKDQSKKVIEALHLFQETDDLESLKDSLKSSINNKQ